MTDYDARIREAAAQDTRLERIVGQVARVRLRDRGSPANTLIVRSTSLGDFAVFLPFLTTVQARYGSEAVDLLVISRTGDVVRLVAGDSTLSYAVVDPGTLRDLRATLSNARRVLQGRDFARVLYATQNSDAPAGKLRKLLMARVVAGWRARVDGLEPHPAIRSRMQLQASLRANPNHVGSDLATSQALAPFLACGMSPATSRQDIVAWLRLTSNERGEVDAVCQNAAPYTIREQCLALYVHAKDERKRWPLDRYIALLQTLLRDTPGLHAFLIGGREDVAASLRVESALAEDPSTQGRVTVTAGRLSVRSTFALLQRCGRFLGNDGAPVHFAALAGCDVLSIFCNWESPGLWEPVAAPRSVSVRPSPCATGPSGYGITDIEVADVLSAMRLLQSRHGAPHRILTVSSHPVELDRFRELVLEARPLVGR